MSWAYTFAPVIGERIDAGTLALDAPAPYVGAVAHVLIANLTLDGLDASRPILAYPRGTGIVLQDRGNADVFVSLVMMAPAVARKGYLELAVTCPDAGGGELPAWSPVEAFFLPVVAVAVAQAVTQTTDPALVTLAEAKQHLRVTDPAQDADVTQKLEAASATIRDYLKDRNDAAWTPTTVPRYLHAATLLLLGHLYEHRGDEWGPDSDTDDRVWNAIANLCRRARDPALA